MHPIRRSHLDVRAVHTNGFVSLGYKTIGEDRHRIHVIDEEKAPLVHEMFELYSTGNYLNKILAAKMYREGLMIQQGSKLVSSWFHDHLSNPFYYGKALMEWSDF